MEKKNRIQLTDFQLKEESQSLYKVVKDNLKDRIEVELGDSKDNAKFYPQAKIQRWDNEVNFSLRYKDGEGEKSESVESKDDTLVWSKGQKEVHIYEKPEVAEDGGLEIEVVLKEKPISNVIEFSIETKGLDFFYQPELEDSEVEEVVEREKISIEEAKRRYRPENIVGSYAVYHSEKQGNYTNVEYKTGKFCHIYRPLVKDSKGSEIWGKLNVDVENKLLTITIDEKWLESAVYPVIVDPTFGYSSIGASSESFSNPYSNSGGCKFTGSAGTIDSMSVYFSCPAPGTGFGLYTNGGTLKEGNDWAIDSNSSAGWITENFTGTTSVSAEDYVLVWGNINTAITVYYDSGTSGQGKYPSSNPFSNWAFASSITFSASTTSRKFSAYINYTVGASTVVRRMFTLTGVGK